MTTNKFKLTNIEAYEKRRRKIIQREYIQQACDFLAQAESALKSGYLFRFRDFARFSAVRAIKAIFVWNDIHPPRETDLHYLRELAKKLEPKLENYSGFLEDLNNYCPDRNTPSENQRNTAILSGMVDFLKDVNTWINAVGRR
ncbi:MAG: HEPN domain-containing protein [Deltaproteobacteria bacterium]|nr:HEPN domain-containing protein [Deltaproteobacteria bacterium]